MRRGKEQVGGVNDPQERVTWNLNIFLGFTFRFLSDKKINDFNTISC